MKCKCCNKDIKQKDFIWKNVPALGISLDEVCDKCALQLMSSFLEENGPEYCRQVAGKEQEYQKAMEILKQLIEQQKADQ